MEASSTKVTSNAQQSNDVAGSTAVPDQRVEAAFTEKEETSSLLTEMSIMGTIAGLFIGTGNITEFPMNVLEYGGWFFVGAHVLLVGFMGLPLSFFELLIGQITGKGATDAYGTYCRAARGIGISLYITSMILMFFYVNMDIDSPGMNMRIVASTFKEKHEMLTCDNEWNTENCVSLYESIRKCPRLDETDDQMAYIEGNCTLTTHDRPLKDAFKEYSDYHTTNPESGFDLYHFLTALFILSAPVALVFLPIKFTFYSFGTLFVVYIIFYLVMLVLIATMITDFGYAFGYIWHRSSFGRLAHPKGINAVISSVFWTLSLFGFLGPIGSFLKPKDSAFRVVFFPVILDLVISILSVMMIAGALCSLERHMPASGYLYSTVLEGNHGLIMYSQLLVSYLQGFHWAALFSFSKCIGYLNKMSYVIIGAKSLFRDHLQYQKLPRAWQGGFIGFFVLLNFILIGLASYPTTHHILSEYFPGSAYSFSCRMMYFVGILVCIHIYGEIDFRIDLNEIYPEKEINSIGQWKSPAGPIVFFCWLHVVPVTVLMSQTFIFPELMRVCFSKPWTIVLPLLAGLIAPVYAVVLIIMQKVKGEHVSDVFRPSEFHPSYRRITKLPISEKTLQRQKQKQIAN